MEEEGFEDYFEGWVVFGTFLEKGTFLGDRRKTQLRKLDMRWTSLTGGISQIG